MDKSSDCSYAEQVYTAQKAGASAAVIANSEVMPTDWPLDVMQDPDGHYGALIHIPSIFVSFKDGAWVKKLMLSSKDNTKFADRINTPDEHGKRMLDHE